MPDHTGNIQPQLDLEEHDHTNRAKRVTIVSGGSSGGLTDTELRATPVPVSSATLATSAKQDTLFTELQLKADLTETQPVSLASVPSHAVTNAGTFAVQADTELPTAAALADGASVTPTTPTVGAAMLGIRSTDSTATNLDRAILSKMFDVDTGAGTQNVVGVLDVVPASGGAIQKTYGAGTTAAGTQRVVLPTDQTAVPTSDVVSTALTTYSVRLTTNATTTPTSSTAYISCIAITTEVIGTTSTIIIRDKQATPLVLVPSITTVATGLTIYNFQRPVKMVSGIDIVTAGAAAATVDVWIDYYQ